MSLNRGNFIVPNEMVMGPHLVKSNQSVLARRGEKYEGC